MSTTALTKAERRPSRRVSAKARAEIPEGEGEKPNRKETGRALINLLLATVRERDLPDRAAPDVLGITQIYWNSICNGHREIRAIGKEKLRRAADFLGRSVIDVYVLADFFDAGDFQVRTNLDDRLRPAIAQMRADPVWNSLAPTDKEWDPLPMRVKLALVYLYEREFGREIFQKAQIETPSIKLPK
jgi:hypothetical protein